jgi:hypothetical protein
MICPDCGCEVEKKEIIRGLDCGWFFCNNCKWVALYSNGRDMLDDDYII